jgi:hypothetical protein
MVVPADGFTGSLNSVGYIEVTMDVLDITAPEIRAELLRIESQRRECKVKWLECVRMAYDAIAKVLMNSGEALDHRTLRLLLPGAVLDVAVGYGWVHHPGKREEYRKRHIYKPFAWVPQDYFVKERILVDIPEQELTMNLGSFRLTREAYEWWLNVLGGRILKWEGESVDAARLARAAASSIATTTRRKRLSKKPDETVRQQRAAKRRAAVEPVLQAKKPAPWTVHFWATKAGLNHPHAAYRYLKGENITPENYEKLASAIGVRLPE